MSGRTAAGETRPLWSIRRRELTDTIATILVEVADGWHAGGAGVAMSRPDDADESDDTR